MILVTVRFFERIRVPAKKKTLKFPIVLPVHAVTDGDELEQLRREIAISADLQFCGIIADDANQTVFTKSCI